MSHKEHTSPPPPEARHPLSQWVREVALSFPDTIEDHPWGDIVFKVNDKMFVVTSVDKGGVCVKANPAELDALLEMPNVARAAYVGRYGWINVDFDSEQSKPFIEGLIRVSYELVSVKNKKKSKKATT